MSKKNTKSKEGPVLQKSRRNWISKNEGKLTVVQMFGFLLIALGVFYLASFLLPSGVTKLLPSFELDHAPTNYGISIAFFATMLGVAFAFPDMLKGQTKDISTMRIIVFMFANVICMLLLKIGWNLPSLTKIGLDGYWVGVIAFLFGAKSAQSYFESKLAVPPTGMAAVPYSNADIAKLAVAQNEQFLKAKFPNILCVSDAVHDLNSAESHIIALYLKDNNTMGIPDKLEVKMPGEINKTIATEIIKGAGEGRLQFGQGDGIVDINNSYSPPESVGSICCAVKSVNDSNFIGIITSAHIYTHGNFDDTNNTVLNTATQRDVFVNGNIIGKWFYKQMLDNQDLIIATLNDKESINQLKKFDDQYYPISDSDVKSHSTKVIILSRENKRTEAFILDYNIGYPFRYENGTFYKKDIILIGNVPDRNISKPVSEKGDSGSCVFISSIDIVTKKETNKMVGILLGANENFTFVLPIQSTLSPNFKII